MMSVLGTARPFLEVASAAALQLMPPHLTPGDVSFNTTDPSWGNPLVLPEEECDRLKIGVIYHSNFSTNTTAVTCLEHAPIQTSSSVIRAVVLAVMAVLSFGGNLATIWSIRRGGRSSGRKHTCHGGAVYALILHLSVADLLVTVFCIAGEAAWSYTVEWIAGDAACKLFKFMQMFSLYLSTFVLVLIGVDRFVVVRYPMKSLSTSRRLNRAIAFVWVLSFLLSIPQVGRH